ncbi:MAG: LLM class flavin-dependent oxidoreductase [Nocardioides sp.]|nr:LLM class flavin-dependent oxidoreductase [Nocardioides sp.]
MAQGARLLSSTCSTDEIVRLYGPWQLLHKARAVRPKDQVDFDVCAPLLDQESRTWLREAPARGPPGSSLAASARPQWGMIDPMTTRRGLFVAPFDALADPRVVGDLAAAAEAAGWDGFFVWDHLQYGDRVAEIADPWTCCAAVAMRTERLVFGPMVTPLARRRPQVLARQAACLAVLSGGRFVLGLGLGDDWVGEFGAFGDEQDPKVRGRMLDDGLEVLTALLAGAPVDHVGDHYIAKDVRFLPAPAVPIWLAGRFGNRAPLRRATRHDGFFVIGLDQPDDLDAVTAGLAEHDPAPGFDVVVDLQPDQDVTPWLDRGASWVLTRIGPYDIDLDDVRRIVDAGP